MDINYQLREKIQQLSDGLETVLSKKVSSPNRFGTTTNPELKKRNQMIVRLSKTIAN